MNRYKKDIINGKQRCVRCDKYFDESDIYLTKVCYNCINKILARQKRENEKRFKCQKRE